jgi:hypothetical protein
MNDRPRFPGINSPNTEKQIARAQMSEEAIREFLIDTPNLTLDQAEQLAATSYGTLEDLVGACRDLFEGKERCQYDVWVKHNIMNNPYYTKYCAKKPINRG